MRVRSITLNQGPENQGPENQGPENQGPERGQRASIWSVPEDWQRWYLALFNIQILCLLGLVCWHEFATAPDGAGAIDILIAVGSSMAGLIILVAAESILLTDVTKMLFTMISDRYLKRQHAKGIAEGSAATQQKWEEWNKRRLAAEAAGEEFIELPPAPPNSNGSG